MPYHRTEAPIAQLDRVLPSEGRGRTFESCWVRQTFCNRHHDWTALAVAATGEHPRTFGRRTQGAAFVHGFLKFRLGVAVIDHAAARLDV